MNKTFVTSNLTLDRIKKYLAHGKRFDGRAPEELRELLIETGISKNAEGSARVKLGKTEVMVGIKMDAGTPYSDSLDKGNLIVSAELLPLSSSKFEAGPPKFQAIEIGRIVDRFVRESKMINLNELCIKEGEKVWNVYIDIYSINDDGNILDAASLGVIIALKNSRIPVYDDATESVKFGEWTDKKIPLSGNIPISLTMHKIGDNFLFDPTLEEEDASEVRVTFGSTKEAIHSMQKGGSTPLSIDDMEKAIDLNEKVREKVLKKLEKYLK